MFLRCLFIFFLVWIWKKSPDFFIYHVEEFEVDFLPRHEENVREGCGEEWVFMELRDHYMLA